MKNHNEPFISGQECASIINHYGRAGLLVKMCLASPVWKSNLCKLYWRESALKSGRQLFKLHARVNEKKQMIPTPTASDFKNANCPPSQKKRNSIPGLIAQVSTGSQLNPRFIEQVMGFPNGWTQLTDSEIQTVRAARRKS